MLSINANPQTPFGAQSLVHFPSYARLDAYRWLTGASKWSDGSTDCDIYLTPSVNLYGGVSQNSNLTIQTNVTNGLKYLEELYNSSLTRSVSAGGYLRLVGDAWFNRYRRLKNIRYNTYQKRELLNFESTISSAVGVIKIVALDTTRFFILYRASGGCKGVVGTINTSTGAVTYGTAVVITSTTISAPGYADIELIDTDKVAVVSNHTSSYTYGTVCTISSSTITVGTPVALAGASSYHVRCVKLDTNKFAAVWGEVANVKAIACTVSGTVITKGSEVVVKATSGQQHVAACQLTTDKFMVSAGENSTAGLFACSVSGTVITVGSELDVLNNVTIIDFYNHGTDKCIAFYGTASTTNVAIYTVSGTTITLGSQLTVLQTGAAQNLGALGTRPMIFNYDTNKLAALFITSNNGSGGAYQSFLIDYTSDVLTADFSASSTTGGAPLVAGLYENGSSSYITRLLRLDDNYFACYSQGGYSHVGKVGNYYVYCGAWANGDYRQLYITYKNVTTEFFNGDTSIGTHTPTLPGIFAQVYKCDATVENDKLYIKIQNDDASAINYEFFDVGVIAT